TPDRERGRIAIFIVDVGRRQSDDLAPGILVVFRVRRVGAERAQRHRAGRGIGRVVDVDRDEPRGVFEVEGAVDALDAAVVSEVPVSGGAVGGNVRGPRRALRVEAVGGGSRGGRRVTDAGVVVGTGLGDEWGRFDREEGVLFRHRRAGDGVRN